MKKYLGKSSKLLFSVVATCSTLIFSNTAAKALNFNFSYAPGTSWEQIMGFEVAGAIWGSYLTDNTTVNIYVETTDLLPDNVIGGALPGFKAGQDYREFRDAIGADITSADDQLAHSTLSLPDGGHQYQAHSKPWLTWDERLQDQDAVFQASFDYYFDTSLTFDSSQDWLNWRADPSTIEQNGNTYLNLAEAMTGVDMTLTRANAKALGLDVSGTTEALDAYILMSDLANESVTWDYNYQRDQNAPANTLDFVGVAIHEIGHALGFVSSVDRPGWLETPILEGTHQDLNGAWGDQYRAQYWSDTVERIKLATSLDMFRFSEEFRPANETRNWIDLSVGGDIFFSLDSINPLGYFATGQPIDLGGIAGDGFQASHWTGTEGSSGIMNPTISAGDVAEISELDLRAFDAIGWDRQGAGGNVIIDYILLENQVKQNIAQQLGVTVAWLEANSSYVANLLSEDRSQDVIDMIEASEIYEWGFGGGDGDGCDPNTQNCGSSQILAQAFANEGLFSQAYWSTLDIETQSVEVPESSPMTALLGLSLLSFGGLVKDKSTRK